MIRRYNMSRSDNALVSSLCMMPCRGGDGNFFVYTGFLVSSAIITSVNLPEGSSLLVDTTSFGENGFRVIYKNLPEDMKFVEFYFMAQ